MVGMGWLEGQHTPARLQAGLGTLPPVNHVPTVADCEECQEEANGTTVTCTECNPGFTLNLPSNECNQLDDCPLLSIPNGMVSYQPPGTPPLEGANASYTCNNGYTLSGNNMRTCQDINNGTWTGSDPSCNRIECPLLIITNGMVSYQPQETPPVVGTTATYTCNEGYTLDGTNVRTCLQAVNNGMWTSINPSCNGGLTSSSGFAMIFIVIAVASLLI